MTELRIRRMRDPAVVLQLVIDRQPLSVDIVDRVTRTRERTYWKAYRIDRGHSLFGLFFRYRLCRGVWEGILLLDEPAVDTRLVRFLNRAHVWSIAGPGSHTRAVLESLPRLTRLTRLDLVHQRNPPKSRGSMPGSTTLGKEHADRLVEFFSHHERFGIPTLAGVREFVDLALERGPAVVVEEDGEIVAGVLLGASTDEWISIDALLVRPDRRGSGLSTIVLSGMHRRFSGGRIGVCGVRSSTNPASYENRPGHTDWIVANLSPPKRFRGHQRMRVASLRFRKRATPWATTYIRPEYLDSEGRLRSRPEAPSS